MEKEDVINTMELTSQPTERSCTKPVKVGQIQIGGSGFAVIAGPCSIESPEQFLETAQAVKRSGACLLRGGIWKMRTSSKTFQGLGAEASHFIKDICRQVNMSLVSEVTDARQIEEIDSLVDMYQVGSRNMHNTSLLKELGRTRKPILLKRGFAALIDEWIHAAEYIASGGNDQIILCERGIRTFETSTRNTLDLNAVVYLKSRTSFPILVDPSHAVGIRHLVSPLALAAAAAGADGVIVEVHPRPHEALSDGQQALTFKDFSELMQKMEKVLRALERPLVPSPQVYQ